MQTLMPNHTDSPFSQHFNANWLKSLILSPRSNITGTYNNHRYSARLIIPDYSTKINQHYHDITKGNLQQFCLKVQVPFSFNHFGVEIIFEDAIELCLHNDEMEMEYGLHQLIAAVGSVVIKNAYLTDKLRKVGHRNRFPNLNFHVDRTELQPTHYSMYARDPYDEEQRFPRTSSTLFIPNIVAYLQAVKEGIVDPETETKTRGTYSLFNDEDVSELMGKIIVEHRWDMPEGIGEISMLDNITALHASYYRDPFVKGYKIGVRYLA